MKQYFVTGIFLLFSLYLLAASPYLSDRILIAAIKHKPSPIAPGILKQIIEANSPVSTDVMYELEQRNPVIPIGIMNQIRALQTGASARFDTERRIAWLSAELLKLQNMLIEAYISSGDMATAKDIMLNSANVYDKQRLAQIFLNEANFSGARNAINLVLQFIPTDQLNEAQNYIKIMNVIIELAETGKSLFEINAAQEQDLREAASSGTMVALQAETILELVFGESFPAVVSKIQPVSNTKLLMSDIDIRKFDNPVYAKLFPNPNNGNMQLEYSLPKGEDGELLILDVSGKEIYKTELLPNQKLLTIPTISIAEGIYLYRVSLGEGISVTEKLVIIR
ncbi:MAG: hypothetical protein A2275_15865 [Bacteroidetes bacterium RIFOXYA12_FULL_35_11]|nr:MAG: hypothetical protein A2X01_15610 [Bacteroidetes bacterium GWF2_35_48]OFY76596.1 MAG: hypothetical protein A2275_15865 [Bacteroidetes bacterium RIFOXYA12_FULL_35_11]OFZ01603.1 MAG: hypothetical protein A2491_12875 [Bacteroidetes bacterium RIFOXYC12_FULL_35_7]